MKNDELVQVGDPFTCPKRAEMSSHGLPPGEDRWVLRGRDRCCSFCGSADPNEVFKFLRRLDGLEEFVDLADRRHKLYLNRKGTKNALEGAIKLYFVHVSKDQWPLFRTAVNEALKKSHEHERERLDRIRLNIAQHKKTEEPRICLVPEPGQ